ncbi:MAG: uroporphyrinogen-III C-methyltransferase [Candidatus Omnitrophica bacterium]|nr:uroporphyrinogen-III C-methyltransferase [Candidatus Omnitrophota bacterium]
METVYLVGAGPGDPGLLTVKGRELLQRADVVIYDHLASDRLLASCQPNAKRIYAGKQKGRRAYSQLALNRLLVREARAGRMVVRLKGGDPFLFGRGGEEALALRQARIPFEVVPGVTSAVAVPAYAGIPITHRGVASSVAIVTGHEDPAKHGRGSVPWDRVATATDTLVCLMGLTTLRATTSALIRHGRAPATPAAVVSWGTHPRQRTVVGTLRTIAADCQQARIAAPAILVVGDVVKLRRRLAWMERRPLQGRRILVTRPADRAAELAGRLEALGADVVTIPAIALVPAASASAFRAALRDIQRFDWVVFTSPEGIDWFQRLAAPLRQDVRALAGRHLAAIGPKTASSLESRGLHVDVVPAAFSQEGLVAAFGRRRMAGRRALLLNAQEARPELEAGLRRLGMAVVRVPIYRTIMPRRFSGQLRAALADPIDLVTATSAMCVEHILSALRAAGLSARAKRLAYASIGPVTSAAVRRHGGRVAVEADTATVEALVRAIQQWSQRRMHS